LNSVLHSLKILLGALVNTHEVLKDSYKLYVLRISQQALYQTFLQYKKKKSNTEPLNIIEKKIIKKRIKYLFPLKLYPSPHALMLGYSL